MGSALSKPGTIECPACAALQRIADCHFGHLGSVDWFHCCACGVMFTCKPGEHTHPTTFSGDREPNTEQTRPELVYRYRQWQWRQSQVSRIAAIAVSGDGESGGRKIAQRVRHARMVTYPLPALAAGMLVTKSRD